MARDETSSLSWWYVSARVGALRVSAVESHIITESENTTSEKAGSEGKIADMQNKNSTSHSENLIKTQLQRKGRKHERYH